ncbi:toll/interleukin-1 receptor domain-containing protein [Ruegeria arenilitoris]|uniref:toll/interleukin-1 receptor domain-containing protein n=1 Tax=Ruegeria arenilitoris TaxID=1173585 RepID=UPI00147F201D|nr:toll/interleukin-1 receptor domain-containing protein [Ruegeria arenilitoris]
MTDIFISHAVADQALADKFVAFLKEAIGVPAKSIFCSSVDGHGIPLGDDFNAYMKEQIQSPMLVILLMTPRYMESWFCLMELGATWAKSLESLPVVVPPIKFNVVSSTLGLKQGWSIENDAKLIELRQKIKATGVKLEPRTEQDWDKKRAIWKVDLKKLLKNLTPATNVTASEYTAVQEELAELKQELEGLQDAYAEASETIEELKAAKDPAAVKGIMAKRNSFDSEAHFNELLDTISGLRPRVSIYFYRNLIMDLYDKAAPIDWYDANQKMDAEAAIQYNIMEPDVPHAYRWTGKKLMRVKVAIKALDEFLESEEAKEFVKERENAGDTMDTDDLEFWEENLT